MSTKSRPSAWNGWLVRVLLQHSPSRTLLFHDTDGYESSCAPHHESGDLPDNLGPIVDSGAVLARHAALQGPSRLHLSQQQRRGAMARLEAVGVAHGQVQRLVAEVEALKVQDALHQRLHPRPHSALCRPLP